MSTFIFAQWLSFAGYNPTLPRFASKNGNDRNGVGS